MDALNHGLGVPGSGAFPQFWGIDVVTRSAGENSFEAESVIISGNPLDPNETYTLAISDFLYSGGNGYEMFKKSEYKEYATVEEVFRNFVMKTDAETLKAISDAEVLK